MIIVCPSCGKNFNVSDDQIPDKGRLLQCSNCKHEWFYTKNTIPIDDNIDELSKDDFTQESFGVYYFLSSFGAYSRHLCSTNFRVRSFY